MSESREEEVRSALEAEYVELNATNAYSTGLTSSQPGRASGLPSAVSEELRALLDQDDVSLDEEV